MRRRALLAFLCGTALTCPFAAGATSRQSPNGLKMKRSSPTPAHGSHTTRYRADSRRLEALAEPGSVFVSQAVFNHVRGRTKVAFEDIGEQSLKNMAEPVRVYRVGSVADTGRDGSWRGGAQARDQRGKPGHVRRSH